MKVELEFPDSTLRRPYGNTVRMRKEYDQNSELRQTGRWSDGKCRRSRTVFTDRHLVQLEGSFKQKKYLTTRERIQLANQLELNELQIKTWYQNRRMKWKKEVGGSLDVLVPVTYL